MQSKGTDSLRKVYPLRIFTACKEADVLLEKNAENAELKEEHSFLLPQNFLC